MTPFSDKFQEDLVLIGDDLAGALLKECTEIAVRVQLGDGKTVKHGPFHTEYLPTETVLAASLTLREPIPPSKKDASPEGAVQEKDEVPDRLMSLLDHALRQIGGDETIGKGLVWCRLLPSGAGGQ